MKSASYTKFIRREEWDSLASLFSDLSYRQCGSYAEAAAVDAGASSEFVALFQSETLIGLANVRIKRLPFLPLGIAYVHYGPLTVQNGNSIDDALGSCLDALIQEYVRRRKLMLRIIPPLCGGQWCGDQAICFEKRGFLKSRRQVPQDTFILDLARSRDDIRKNLDSKWRNDLVRAEKSNIRITRSALLEEFDIFEKIFLELIQHKGFKANQDVSFFRRVQKNAQAYERLVIHLAWHGSDLVGGHLGSFVGTTAVYLLGAATSKGRDMRASFLLQWAVIEHAQSIGTLFYDLGGVDKVANPNVYRFKQRLNGRYVSEIGPYDLAPGPITGRFLGLMEDAYNWISR